jgi:hypothetical protein
MVNEVDLFLAKVTAVRILINTITIIFSPMDDIEKDVVLSIDVT